jgi:hypothetical protein
MGSIALREVKGVKAPEASELVFTGVTVPQASLTNVIGGCHCWWQRWIKWHIGRWCFLRFFSQYRLLCFLSALGSCGHPSYVILQASSREGLSHVDQLRTASCQQSI